MKKIRKEQKKLESFQEKMVEMEGGSVEFCWDRMEEKED